MKLVIKDHHSKTRKSIEITPENIKKIEQFYNAEGFFSQYHNLSFAAHEFAKYLSNHHIDATIVIDQENTQKEPPKDLDKSVKSPSKHIPLSRLEQIKQDNYLGEGGKDYSQEETDQAILDRKVAQADKQVKQAKAKEFQQDSGADYSWMFSRNSPFGIKVGKK
jgi:hypothetical protein